MVKAFQNVGYFMWRHLLVMIMLCIIAAVLYTNKTLSLFNSSVLIAAFAAFDFAKTKWIKIDSLQKEHIKKFAKFMWRHLLTLIGFSFTTYVLVEGHISWENTVSFFICSIMIDWVKMNFRYNNVTSYDTSDPLTKYSRRENDWSCIGSSAWMSNPGTAGSPANHLYNLGYNPGSTRY